MAKCSKCGSELEDNQKFCQNCGTPTSLRCPHCGINIKEGSKFCTDCGTNILTSEPFYKNINNSSSKIVSISDSLKKFFTLQLIFEMISTYLLVITSSKSSLDILHSAGASTIFGTMITILFVIQAFSIYCNILAMNGDEKLFKIKTYLLICIVLNLMGILGCISELIHNTSFSSVLGIISCIIWITAYYRIRKEQEDGIIILAYIGGVLGMIPDLIAL